MSIGIEWIFLALVFSLQLLFFGYFLIGLIRIKKSEKPAEEGYSIIVAAKNEETNLNQLVPLLLNQAGNNEVIIVNDQSTDGTFDLLVELDKEHPNFKAVQVEHTPEHISRKKYALTLGVKAASNENLIFIDADCRPSSENWGSNMSSRLEEPGKELVIGYSPYLVKGSLINLLIRFETMLTGIQYLGKASWGRSYMAVGRNLGYKKSLFLKNNGFGKYAKLLSGDDDLFVNEHSNKRNTAVILQPDSVTYSEPKQTLTDYVIQKKRHYSVGKYYKKRDRFYLAIFTITKALMWLFPLLALYLSNNYYILLLVFVFWALMYTLSVGVLNKKSGTRFPVILTIFLDLIFGMFYLIVGIMTLTTREVKWK